MMYRASDNELNSVIGRIYYGYTITRVKRRSGDCSDSDSYSIAEGVNEQGMCVTWQFHFQKAGAEPDIYWGHYFENANGSDFEARH